MGWEAIVISLLSNPDVQKALIAILTPIILAGVKSVSEKLPKSVVPALSPILGVLLAQVVDAATGSNISAAAGAVAGGAGVGVREIIDQTKKAWANRQANSQPSQPTETETK